MSAQTVPSRDVQEAAWAEVDKLIAEFPNWEFTWTEYPDGWRFVGKPFPPDPFRALAWVIGESAGQVRAGIRLRQTPEGGTL